MSYYTNLHKPIMPIMTPDEVEDFGARQSGRLVTLDVKPDAFASNDRKEAYIAQCCATHAISREQYDASIARMERMYLAGNYARLYLGEDGMEGECFTAIDRSVFAEGKEFCGWEFNGGYIDYKVECIVFLPGNKDGWTEKLYGNVPAEYFLDVPFRTFSSGEDEGAMVDEGTRLFKVLFYRDYQFNYSVGRDNSEQVFTSCEELQAFLRRLSAESHSREDRNEDFSWLCTLWTEPFVAYTL